jgi:hypothetical protein
MHLLSCLRTFLLLSSRCDDEAVVVSSINSCITLFRATTFPNVCIDILTHLNRMVYRGIRYFDDIKIEVMLHMMDIDASYIKFPQIQAKLYSLFEALKRSDRYVRRFITACDAQFFFLFIINASFQYQFICK